MTAMPQMVALFNGVGGGAVALISFVGVPRGARRRAAIPPSTSLIPILFAAIIGSVSFWGSNIAFGKLQEILPGRPIQLPGPAVHQRRRCWQYAVGCAIAIAVRHRVARALFVVILVAAAVLGNMFVLPIGGADMPVVISLLNAFTGLSAAAAGIALDNVALIVAGMLVGASGSILTILMAEAMNRSIAQHLQRRLRRRHGAWPADGEEKPVRSTDAADVAIQLAYASRVVVVPGYGMAVAQAQHTVRELANELEKRGVEVDYAIHPVAGRMPGHMNVLLAEADVPYEQLKEMDDINPELPQTDVALVIGANDVTNPAARRRTRRSTACRSSTWTRRLGDRPEAVDEHRLRRHRQPALLQGEHVAAVRRREGVGAEGPEGRRRALAPSAQG